MNAVKILIPIILGHLLSASASTAQDTLLKAITPLLQDPMKDVTPHYCGSSDPKPKGYQKPEKQFPLEPSRFLERKQVPEHILNLAKQSTRRLCTCNVSFSNCITIFAITDGGVFITNEHAVQFLESNLRARKEDPTRYGGPPCKYDYVAVDDSGTKVPVTPRFVKRGAHKRNANDVGMSLWKPSEHFKLKTEDFEDRTTDLATLEITELETAMAIPYAKEKLRTGSLVYHFGFPAVNTGEPSKETLDPFDLIPSVSSGQVSSIAPKNVEGTFLGIEGTSGGPVVSEKGELVGIFWGKALTWRESLDTPEIKHYLDENGYPPERSFFIPAEYVKEFLAK